MEKDIQEIIDEIKELLDKTLKIDKKAVFGARVIDLACGMDMSFYEVIDALAELIKTFNTVNNAANCQSEEDEDE